MMISMDDVYLTSDFRQGAIAIDHFRYFRSKIWFDWDIHDNDDTEDWIEDNIPPRVSKQEANI